MTGEEKKKELYLRQLELYRDAGLNTDVLFDPITASADWDYQNSPDRGKPMAEQDLPQDGDANGAYHIALQGLRLVRERIENGRVKTDGKGEQSYNWFRFVQKKEYRK